jgi:hypothetical protein
MPSRLSGWLPLVAAFVIWFVHFMVCWAAAELLWPRQWLANGLAWVATLLALGALGWLWRRISLGPPSGGLVGWARRVGQGATVIAVVAVLFSAVPSLVFLP